MAMRSKDAPAYVVEDDDDPEPGLGARIRSARQLRNFSQVALARAMRVDQGLLWKWEHGKRTPRLAKLIAISRILDVRLDWLALALGPMTRPRTRT